MKRHILPMSLGTLLIASIFITSCSKSDDEPIATIQFRQYADNVIGFSTEYNPSPEDWSAFKALGKENVYPEYGDIEGAWTTEDTYIGREHLVLGYDTAQTISKIEIYETYNAGAIDTVYVRNSSTKMWAKVYEGTASAKAEEARIFTVTIPETNYLVDAVRLAIDGKMVDDWIEIDAVAITGKRKK